MIQILAPDPTQARLLAERLYPQARICGEPVSLGPATQCDAAAFHSFLLASTRHTRYSHVRPTQTKRL